jgi:arginyl-tRNA synthetase
MKPLVQEILRRGAAKKSEGSVIVSLDNFKLPPALIQKSDGASLYLTRDIENLQYRLAKYKPLKILYVVANEQTLHFQQLFAIAKILGLTQAETVHVKFGMMLAPGGKKFATREGRLIPLQGVLHEAIERSRNIVEKLNPELSTKEKEKIAKAVGIGAVKFFDLSQNRVSDIVFDWDKMLNLKGSSAPYIQYTYARLMSILRKAGDVKKFNPVLLQEEKELALLSQLVHFPEIVEDAAARYEPNHIAGYLVRLAEKANAFYETLPVLKAERKLQNARLALISAVTIVIKSGLKLLGIEVLERM